jgi:hypothetical protein
MSQHRRLTWRSWIWCCCTLFVKLNNLFYLLLHVPAASCSHLHSVPKSAVRCSFFPTAITAWVLQGLQNTVLPYEITQSRDKIHITFRIRTFLCCTDDGPGQSVTGSASTPLDTYLKQKKKKITAEMQKKFPTGKVLQQCVGVTLTWSGGGSCALCRDMPVPQDC